jgi:hypothetical protein
MHCCFSDTAAAQIGEWVKFNIHQFAGLSKGRTLAAVTKEALTRLGLMSYFDPNTLDQFLRELESLYKDNDYHSGVHAADVVQANYCALAMVSCCALLR